MLVSNFETCMLCYVCRFEMQRLKQYEYGSDKHFFNICNQRLSPDEK